MKGKWCSRIIAPVQTQPGLKHSPGCITRDYSGADSGSSKQLWEVQSKSNESTSALRFAIGTFKMIGGTKGQPRAVFAKIFTSFGIERKTPFTLSQAPISGSTRSVSGA